MANPLTATELQAARLKKACDEAYIDTQAKNSCSHAVWYVLKALINQDEPYRTANSLVAFMTGSPLWREVKLADVSDLSNKGIVVVGGKTETDHGHVIVVYPGPLIAGGGYRYPHKDKTTHKISMLTMGSHGKKAPCLSTSNGSWPGAMSDGDKSVFDPWGDVTRFALVKFWTMDKP